MVVFPSNTGKVVTVLSPFLGGEEDVCTHVSRARIKVSKLERLSRRDSDFSPSELKRGLRGGEAARKKIERKRREETEDGRGIGGQPPLILL